MSEEKKDFIPEITINNTKQTKIATIDGEEQEVDVPPQEGFNIKTRDLNGDYNKAFFVKDLEATILFDRYQILSKYNNKENYQSNEFEFTGPRNHVRVYDFTKKEVIYEGPYAGAKKEFSTGQINIHGREEKTYDVFSILYILFSGEVFRLRLKLNQNNNWFDYKDGCKVDPSSREDTADYRGLTTKFGLSKKKFGVNDIWICTMQTIGHIERTPIDEVAEKLIADMDGDTAKYAAKKAGTAKVVMSNNEIIEGAEEEINVGEIPF